MYIDFGLRLAQPLDSIVQPTDRLVVVWEGPGVFGRPFDDPQIPPGLYQAFLACEPGHPAMIAVLDLCMKNIEECNYGLTPLFPTGPVCAYQAFEATVESFNPDGGFDPVSGVRVLFHRKYSGVYPTRAQSADESNRLIKAKTTKYYSSGKNYHDNYGNMWMRRIALGEKQK